jgi:hypothetical protein
VAKFFPHYDGPYNMIDTHLCTSNYTLKLPNLQNTYPTYHVSELKAFVLNDVSLFPSCELSNPQPVVIPDGLEEFLVEDIIDARQHGHGW